jgi:hypothetical protein
VTVRRELEVVKRRPALVIRVPLEENVGALYIDAESFDDEIRLRTWLRRTSAFSAIRRQIDSLLDELDEDDREGEAA